MRRMSLASSTPLPFLDEAKAGLSAHFGLTEFRPGQAEVISKVMDRQNVVVVMPTGAGKSLCYQLPAMMLPGITVVVSPLIALMKDQVEQLHARGIAATYINSSLSDLERAERLRGMRERRYKLVYVAPERFRSQSFVDSLCELGVDLFAVDEAHCISQWGHDFRPDYAQLGQIRKRLRPARTVALTATATPEVRDDIVRVLLMKDPLVFVHGFDRKNLFLEVVPVRGDEDRRLVSSQVCKDGGSGIIYCSTRKSAESIHKALESHGHDAVLYHAGMDDQARNKAQDAFMSGKDAIAVATNAFGMGIDKPDIRFVVHANIPRAVEAYYQEIGRAGRDGLPARAVLLFNHADVYTQERLIESNHPSETLLTDLWNLIWQEESIEQSVHHIAVQIGSSEFEVSAALRVLERAGKLERGSRGEGAWTLTLTDAVAKAQPHSADSRALLEVLKAGHPVDRPITTELSVLARKAKLTVDQTRHGLQLLEKSHVVKARRPFAGRSIRVLQRVPFRELGLNLAAVREQERRSNLLLKRMTDYAYAKRCRRAFIIRYFGEELEWSKCDGCDVCTGPRTARPAAVSVTAPPTSLKGSVGSPIAHSELAAEELRRWRKELAQDLGIAPYIIFNDRTLLALATALPLTKQEFLNVKGTGESRWERFGSKIAEISMMARASGFEAVPAVAAPRRRRDR